MGVNIFAFKRVHVIQYNAPVTRQRRERNHSDKSVSMVNVPLYYLLYNWRAYSVWHPGVVQINVLLQLLNHIRSKSQMVNKLLY